MTLYADRMGTELAEHLAKLVVLAQCKIKNLLCNIFNMIGLFFFLSRERESENFKGNIIYNFYCRLHRLDLASSLLRTMHTVELM